MTLPKSALSLLLLTAIVGGGTSPFAKHALQVFPPFVYIFLRFLIASAILLPLSWGALRKLRRDQLVRLSLLSLLAMFNMVLFTYGIRLTSAVAGQTLYVGVPILAVLVTYILGTEKITRTKVVGIGLGLIGSLSIILLPAWAKGIATAGNIWGNILILIAVISFTVYTVLSKRYQQEHSPLVVTTMLFLISCIGALVILPFEAMAVGSWWRHLNWQSILSLLYVGVLGTSLFYYLYQYTIKQAGSMVTTIVFYLLPIASFMWAYLLLDEVITLEFILGTVLIFWGAWLAGRK